MLPSMNMFLDPQGSRFSVQRSQVLTLHLHSGHLMVAGALLPEMQPYAIFGFVTPTHHLARKGMALTQNS